MINVNNCEDMNDVISACNLVTVSALFTKETKPNVDHATVAAPAQSVKPSVVR